MRIIGHRGARGLAPENTLTAMHAALDHGVDELEFDLRVTKDGRPVLSHDPFIIDTKTGAPLVIAEHTYADLHKHKPDLVTFSALLHAIGHPVPLYVEVKPDEPLEAIIFIIRHHVENGWSPKDFLLASFSQKTLLELHEALPHVPTVVLEKWSGVRAGRRARQLKTTYICMNQRWLWWGFIRSMKLGGYKLYAYTVNNPAQAKRWQKHGLYGIVTDYPDRFQSSSKN
jgi:glycerophosphoryl diester phosphodiesterase